MKILVRSEEYYGKVRVYPLCATALVFASIAGTKTLTTTTINLIKVLGYEIEEAPTLNKELIDGYE